jgi:gliding motility-associated-like protein
LPYLWNNIQYTAPGTYQVTLTSATGCDSISKLELTVDQSPDAPIVTSNAPLCAGNDLILKAVGIAGATYQWKGPNGFTSVNQNPIIKAATTASTGTYSVSVSANNCTSIASSINVTVTLSPIVSANQPLELYEGDTAILNPAVTGSNLRFKWTPNLNFISPDTVRNPVVIGLSNITYQYIATNTGGCSATGSIVVRVLPRLKPIYIPNVFSPNGDGINDKWVIDQLAPYANATVNVYTRYGRSVFNSVGYKIPWNGTINGEPLPAGVYYYIIQLKQETKPISGWVTILR